MVNNKYPCIHEYDFPTCTEKTFNSFSGFMLIYVKEGTGTFYINHQVAEFGSGTVVIMSCMDYLKMKNNNSPVKLTALEVSEDAFSGRILEFFSIRQLPIITTFGTARNKLENLLEMMNLCIGSNSENNEIFLRNLSKEILIYAIKSHGKYGLNTVFDIKTELAILYIYSHFKETLSIEKVAAQVHYSTNYFYHSFQKHTNTTFQKFLHNLRLDYATNLIRFTDLTISDICYECGYNSVQYFSTAFRKKFGMSPKNYISNLNTKEKNL